MAKTITKIGPFTLNNDLSEIKFSFHNKIHFFGSMFLALFSNFFIAYGLGVTWEILDGFKPWYTEFEYNPKQPKWLNYFKENFLYADGFSYQDAVVWDLMGATIGTCLNCIIYSFTGINLSII